MPGNPSKKSQPEKSRHESAPLLPPEGLRNLESDLAVLRELSPFARRQLEELATGDTTDLNKLRTLYNSIPVAATKALAYLASINEEEYESVSAQLGDDGKELSDLRGKFLSVSAALLWLRKESRGIVNSWSRLSSKTSYDLDWRYPTAEVWLYDLVGNEVFHSRSEVDDFVKLSRALLETSTHATNKAVERELELSADFVKDTQSAIDGIRTLCQQLEEALGRAPKKGKGKIY